MAGRRELEEAMRELRRLRVSPGRQSPEYKRHVAYLARMMTPCCRAMQKASDFPEGTRLIVTARIETPNGRQE